MHRHNMTYGSCSTTSMVISKCATEVFMSRYLTKHYLVHSSHRPDSHKLGLQGDISKLHRDDYVRRASLLCTSGDW